MATRDLTMIEPDDVPTTKIAKPVITRPQRIRPSTGGRAVAKANKQAAGLQLQDLTKIEPDDATATYAKGGSVYRRVADGVAKRGKTKGRII